MFIFLKINVPVHVPGTCGHTCTCSIHVVYMWHVEGKIGTCKELHVSNYLTYLQLQTIVVLPCSTVPIY